MKFLTSIILLVTVGCAQVLIDPSVDAFNAGDFSLIHSACRSVPGRGLDSCLVTSGTPINQTWVLIVPQGPGVLGGEVDVYFRGLHRQYEINGHVVSIPWADFFESKVWASDMDGEAQALLVLAWKDSLGVDQTTKYRGLAKIVVVNPNYTRMPIDSGFTDWQSECKIQYSTSGRSAIECH